MAKESTQQKLSRIRPPRVQITYDVEIGDAVETKELPFVVGVLADLSGTPTAPLPPVKERKFVEITPDNFDNVLANMTPRVAFSVENTLAEKPGAGQLHVDLSFESLDDFSPDRIAEKVAPLRELLELRIRLSDLRGSLQGNDKLDDALFTALTNTEQLNKLRAELDAERDK